MYTKFAIYIANVFMTSLRYCYPRLTGLKNTLRLGYFELSLSHGRHKCSFNDEYIICCHRTHFSNLCGVLIAMNWSVKCNINLNQSAFLVMRSILSTVSKVIQGIWLHKTSIHTYWVSLLMAVQCTCTMICVLVIIDIICSSRITFGM